MTFSISLMLHVFDIKIQKSQQSRFYDMTNDNVVINAIEKMTLSSSGCDNHENNKKVFF